MSPHRQHGSSHLELIFQGREGGAGEPPLCGLILIFHAPIFQALEGGAGEPPLCRLTLVFHAPISQTLEEAAFSGKTQGKIFSTDSVDKSVHKLSKIPAGLEIMLK